MNKFKFYGTSNANPHPDRRQSGLLFTIEGNHYLFDCGDGIASALWNDVSVCLNRLQAVFFSHRHADHIGGFATLVLLMHQRIKKSTGIQPGEGVERKSPPKNNKNPECAIFIPGDEDNAQFFSELLDRTHMAEFDTAYNKSIFPISGENLIYQDRLIKVSSFPTFHAMDSCGFIIEISNVKIIYSGDIKHPDVVAKVIGKDNYDFVIIENAHFTPNAIKDALKGLLIKNVLITHQKDEYLLDRDKVKKDLASLTVKSELFLIDDGNEFEF